ncbi:MAG: asparagine synthase (glutamine-hydrolyzing) [Bryobacteraceae bacterium]|jgi:asparagine synthase (glutamine-hydrolysing)
MCGIAGFATIEPEERPATIIEGMTDTIRHRGPDDSGFYRDEWVSLGHRRLSIVDLALGHQPLANEDRDAWIVFNGEIFNHADLRPDLERAGHRYATRSDTETIVHAYEEYGPECVNRLRGMFSLAIWDRRRKTLFCARDRLGKKPFYYYWDGRLFAFASEIKALFEHPAISPRLREDMLPEYLAFGYLSGEETLFSGIRQLMPGHRLTLRMGIPGAAPAIERYWEIPQPGQPRERDETAWILECRQRLEQAVETRLMSDVPLGMFLSGGVDSSAIAALMKRMVPGPVETFAVGYREAAYSELGYARQVARSLGTNHHEVTVGMDEFFGALPRLIWHEDKPITWPSSISLYFVSKLASERVKVVLTGEGSDELFGGYGRYRFQLLNQRCLRAYKLLPGFLRRGMRGAIADSPLLSGDLRRKLGHTFLGRGERIESLYLDNFYAAFSADEQASLLPRGGASPYAGFMDAWDARGDTSPIDRLLYADQKTYMVELLMKQDRMSMACSIESRVPFLDHPFVEFAARVPGNLKIRNGVGKYIVKKAAADLVSPDILYRKKMGFPTPIRQWLRDGRAKAMLADLLDRNGFIAAYLDLPVIEKLLESHQRGSIDATDRIWRLLNLQVWGDLFLTGRRAGVWEGSAASPAQP